MVWRFPTNAAATSVACLENDEMIEGPFLEVLSVSVPIRFIVLVCSSIDGRKDETVDDIFGIILVGLADGITFVISVTELISYSFDG